MVAVAAILVASVRLHFLDVVLNLRHRGPNVISCDATLVKGQEMGWFEHGSTIIVLVPDGFTQCEDVTKAGRSAWGSHCCGYHEKVSERELVR